VLGYGLQNVICKLSGLDFFTGTSGFLRAMEKVERFVENKKLILSCTHQVPVEDEDGKFIPAVQVDIVGQGKCESQDFNELLYHECLNESIAELPSSV
jgi:hypothetical protein